MEQTSLEELKRTAASGVYRRIPIWREIFSDIATPVQVLKKLLAVSDHCFLLESAEDNKQWGRYSFLGFDPAMELTCMNHQVTITTDHVEQFETENPAQQRQRTSGQGGKARGQQQRMPRYLQQSPTPWKRFTAQPFRLSIRCRTSSKRVQKKTCPQGG